MVSNSNKPVTTEAETHKSNASPPGDAKEYGEQEAATRYGKKSPDDEVRSDDSPYMDTDTDSDLDSVDGPQALFAEYSRKVARKAAHKARYTRRDQDQDRDSKFVEGLVNYMRVVEGRMCRLEDGLRSLEKRGPMIGSPKVDEDSSETSAVEQPKGDNSIEVSVKFFQAAFYLRADGSFPDVLDRPEKGTFVCNHDIQHLIRVLYSKKLDDGRKPRKEADLEPPKAADIDIVKFGVSSEAISGFFAKHLGIEADPDHIIRFMTPFRPVLRNLGVVREQLKKLERAYGSV